MTLALFDILQGEFRDGTPVHEHGGAGALTRSIRDHLARLLNARSGVLEHLPDYGLPDVPSMYAGLPYSMEDMAAEIQKLIVRYEPRLKHVQVQAQPRDDQDSVVNFQILGALNNGAFAQFKTYFKTGGHAQIREGAVGDR